MTGTSTVHGDSTYVLGHADAEVQRLMLQARLYDDYTEHALRLAGLRPGMRVLDVGCGPGDVSFLAAKLVGPTGTVLGVDASSDIVAVARSRAAQKALSTLSFQAATIADIALDEPVDAVIGRLILMHLPDTHNVTVSVGGRSGGAGRNLAGSGRSRRGARTGAGRGDYRAEPDPDPVRG